MIGTIPLGKSHFKSIRERIDFNKSMAIENIAFEYSSGLVEYTMEVRPLGERRVPKTRRSAKTEKQNKSTEVVSELLRVANLKSQEWAAHDTMFQIGVIQ